MKCSASIDRPSHKPPPTHARRTRGRLGHALPSACSCSSSSSSSSCPSSSCCSPGPALLLAPILWRLPTIPSAVPSSSSSCSSASGWRLLRRGGRGWGRLGLLRLLRRLLRRRLLRRLALAILSGARGVASARPAASPREEGREGKHRPLPVDVGGWIDGIVDGGGEWIHRPDQARYHRRFDLARRLQHPDWMLGGGHVSCEARPIQSEGGLHRPGLSLPRLNYLWLGKQGGTQSPKEQEISHGLPFALLLRPARAPPSFLFSLRSLFALRSSRSRASPKRNDFLPLLSFFWQQALDQPITHWCSASVRLPWHPWLAIVACLGRPRFDGSIELLGLLGLFLLIDRSSAPHARIQTNGRTSVDRSRSTPFVSSGCGLLL